MHSRRLSLWSGLIGLLVFGLMLHAAKHEHGAQRGVQSLDVWSDGNTIDRLTGETREGSSTSQIVHTRSKDGGATWSPAVRVDQGMPAPFGLRRGSDAQIASGGDRLIAVWTTAGTDKWGSGPMATALSDDGGKTWRAGPNPADDGSTTGHGFIDIAADRTGAFHLTWLDSRDGTQGLRYARSNDGGKSWTRNVTLKAATCECCSNAMAVGERGMAAILFRDRSPRDMAVVSSKDGGREWLAAKPVGRFHWVFDGCPHVGGGLVFGPNASPALHAVVWTGTSEHTGVYYVSSPDMGETWDEPRRLGTGSASHPDLAIGADGRIAAVWDQYGEGETGIWAATSNDGGKIWSRPVQISAAGAVGSHPRVVAVQGSFRAFWTERTGEGVSLVGTAEVAGVR